MIASCNTLLVICFCNIRCYAIRMCVCVVRSVSYFVINGTWWVSYNNLKWWQRKPNNQQGHLSTQSLDSFSWCWRRHHLLVWSSFSLKFCCRIVPNRPYLTSLSIVLHHGVHERWTKTTSWVYVMCFSLFSSCSFLPRFCSGCFSLLEKRKELAVPYSTSFRFILAIEFWMIGPALFYTSTPVWRLNEW